MPRYVEAQSLGAARELGLRVEPRADGLWRIEHVPGDLRSERQDAVRRLGKPEASYRKVTFHKQHLEEDAHLDAVLLGPGHPLYAAVDERLNERLGGLCGGAGVYVDSLATAAYRLHFFEITIRGKDARGHDVPLYGEVVAVREEGGQREVVPSDVLLSLPSHPAPSMLDLPDWRPAADFLKSTYQLDCRARCQKEREHFAGVCREYLTRSFEARIRRAQERVMDLMARERESPDVALARQRAQQELADLERARSDRLEGLTRLAIARTGPAALSERPRARRTRTEADRGAAPGRTLPDRDRAGRGGEGTASAVQGPARSVEGAEAHRGGRRGVLVPRALYKRLAAPRCGERAGDREGGKGRAPTPGHRHSRARDELLTSQGARKVHDSVTPGKVAERMKLGEVPAPGEAPRLGVKASEVRDSFFSYLDPPRVDSESALRRASARGVAESLMAYSTSATPTLGADGKFQVSRERVMLGRQLADDEIDLESGFVMVPSAVPDVPLSVPPSPAEGGVPVPSGGPGAVVTPTPTAGAAPTIPGGAAETAVRRVFRATRDQVFKAFPAIANLAERSDGGKVTIQIDATSQASYDPSWLRNAVDEPLDEADVERNPG